MNRMNKQILSVIEKSGHGYCTLDYVAKELNTTYSDLISNIDEVDGVVCGNGYLHTRHCVKGAEIDLIQDTLDIALAENEIRDSVTGYTCYISAE